jgi:N-acyl-D-amino-acid deacylase
MMRNYYFLAVIFFVITGCTNEKKYDKIIRNGLIDDGRGGAPYKADIAINADTIAMIGDLSGMTAKEEPTLRAWQLHRGLSISLAGQRKV